MNLYPYVQKKLKNCTLRLAFEMYTFLPLTNELLPRVVPHKCFPLEMSSSCAQFMSSYRPKKLMSSYAYHVELLTLLYNITTIRTKLPTLEHLQNF